MQIDNIYGGGGGPAFGGGSADTLLHPIVIVGMAIAIVLIFVLPRRYVIVPILLATFLVPLGQQLVTAGLHWQAPRIIVLCGLLRMAIGRVTSSKTLLAGGFNAADWALIGCGLCQTVSMILLYQMDPGVIYNQFGFLMDFVAAYLMVRAYVETEDDIYLAIKCMALLTVILAFGMVREQMTMENMFGVLGGTRSIPDVREGRIRSTGVFQHSIIAGSFAATLLPLFFLLWKNGKAKISALIGMAGCTIMTLTSNSSTPLLTYVAGVFAVCLWPLRAHMRFVRRGLVAVLVVLQLVMIAPVWWLIARIDLTGGSSGYHRADLVDQFVNHFRDWWLIGTKDAATWGYDMWDQQNQYVNIGETGGLLALILFLFVITRYYIRLGVARKLVEGTEQEWVPWLLGAALFSNIVAFFGVNYFDQAKVGWYLMLAMISAAATSISQTAAQDDADETEESELSSSAEPLSEPNALQVP